MHIVIFTDSTNYESQKGETLEQFAERAGLHYGDDCFENDRDVKSANIKLLVFLDEEGNEFELGGEHKRVFSEKFDEAALEGYDTASSNRKSAEDYRRSVEIDYRS